MKFQPTLGANYTGRLGGMVASHNTYGPYFRTFAVPVNRNTPGQQAQRQAFGSVAQLWRSLNTGDQNAWTLAAPQNTVPNSIGGSLTLAGQALFMRMNTLRQRLGLPIVVSAPTSTDVPTITLPTVVLDLDGSLTITFDAADEWNAASGGILISASPLLSAGRNFNSQFTDVDGLVFPDSTPQALQLPFSTIAGGRIQLRYRSTTPDGRLSQLTYQDLTTPVQARILSIVVTSGTEATMTLSIPVASGDVTAADIEINGSPVSSLAQGPTSNTIILTGTGFAAILPWTAAPTGAWSNYTQPQAGTTA